MYLSALILFAIAAVFGVTMAIPLLRSRTTPKTRTAVIHGLFAAGGLVVLLIASLQGDVGTIALTALVVLLLAALGGFGLLSFHLRDRALPPGLAIGHALLAVIGVVLLLWAVIAAA